MSSSTLPPSSNNDAESGQQTMEADFDLQRHQSELSQSSSSAATTSSSSNDIANNNIEADNSSDFATLIGSTANLCSATLGAGILALPFAFYQAGIICGMLLLLLSAWATFSSIEMLAETYDRYRASTYESAVERGLGRRFRIVVEYSILIFCCGTAIGYVIAVGDILDQVIPYLTRARKQALMSLVWLVAMLPLSCLRTMKSLECASTIGIFSIGTLLVAAVVHLVRSGTGGDEDDDGDYFRLNEADDRFEFEESPSDNNRYESIVSVLGPAGGSWVSVLRACPIFFYAFSSQVNVAQIFEELPGRHGNNPQKIRTMSRVTLLGATVCGSLYACLSLVTLADFGNRVQPNILSCYDLRDCGAQPLLHVAFLGMALAVIIAFPLNIFPARVSLIQMWKERKHRIREADRSSSPPVSDMRDIRQPLLSSDSQARNTGYDFTDDTEPTNSNDEGDDPPPLSIPADSPSESNAANVGGGGTKFDWAQHTFLTLLLAGMALGLALVVPNISMVFGLLGGTTSSLLGFVVPGLLGLQLDRNRIDAWILVVFGSFIGVLTTGATVYSMVRHD